jgi:flagellin-specific chaperone FliS
MKISLTGSLKYLSLDLQNPKSFDELLNELYWYADTQLQQAREKQQPEAIMQWEHRLNALDLACQMLDEFSDRDPNFLIY